LDFAGIALELRLIVRFGMINQERRDGMIADMRLISLTLAALIFGNRACGSAGTSGSG
jgi:hypothetical protein